MLILFSEQAWEEYAYWLDNDIKIAKKIKELITAITKEPFNGIGKPEPLKGFGLEELQVSTDWYIR